MVRKTDKQLADDAEGKRRVAEVKADKKFMEGVYRSLADAQRGEKGTPGKDVKRKYKRA